MVKNDILNYLLGIKSKKMESEKLFSFFGHHKCATTWVHSIVQNVTTFLGLTYGYTHDQRSLGSFLNQNPLPNFLVSTNAKSSQLAQLPDFKGFHVIRDPRDIVVSGYFSHLYSHPEQDWLKDHRARLKEVTKEKGLFLEIEFEKFNFDALSDWDYSRSDVLEIKMEDLSESPYETMVEAFQFIGLADDSEDRFKGKNTIPIPELLGILYKHRFSAKANGRKLGQEDSKNHYRKGVAGDWKNHFNDEHKEFFKRKHSDLLIKLGYEQDAAW